MSLNDRSATSRQFVATSAAYSPVWERSTKYWQAGFGVIAMLAFLVTMGPSWGLKSPPLPHIDLTVGLSVLAGLVLAVSVGVGAYLLWRSRRKYLITATNEGLIIDRRPGDVYSLNDAEVGPWSDTGVALHLQCGCHRFLLGARERRVDPAAPSNAPHVQLVDAWMSASEFDDLLSLRSGGSRAAPLGAAPAKPGEPTRYELVGLPQRYSGHFWNKQPVTPPDLILEIGLDDAVRIIDAHTKALIASSSLARVTATPARYVSWEEGKEIEQLLILDLPGLEPVRIRARPMPSSTDYRYAWSDSVGHADQPTYVVTEGEWLALVEKFGLGSLIADEYASGEIARRNRRAMISAVVGFALVLVGYALSAYQRYSGQG